MNEAASALPNKCQSFRASVPGASKRGLIQLLITASQAQLSYRDSWIWSNLNRPLFKQLEYMIFMAKGGKTNRGICGNKGRGKCSSYKNENSGEKPHAKANA